GTNESRVSGSCQTSRFHKGERHHSIVRDSLAMKVLVITAFPPTIAPEADKALHLCEQLAARGIEVHVATTEGSIGSTRPGLYVHAQLRDWSWRDLPRLRCLLKRYVPDVVLLSYLAWAYKYHPMTTFIPSVVKRILPGSRVVTLFEAAEGSAPSLLPIVSR